jgi:hypothetical protein
MADHPRTTDTTVCLIPDAGPGYCGVAVFAFGVLAGSGIAAWIMPPS